MKNSLTTKLYYSISEVAEIAALQPYTLRSWEKEFACLRPRRIRGKNRAYRERDIHVVLLIKRLLYEERYTVKGASQKLKNEPELVRQAVEQPALPRPEAAAPPGAAPAPAPQSERESEESPGAEGGTAPVDSPGPDLPTVAAPAVGPDLVALKRLIEGARKELYEVLRMLR